MRDCFAVSRRYAHLNGLGCFKWSDTGSFRHQSRNAPVLMLSRGKPLLTDDDTSFKRALGPRHDLRRAVIPLICTRAFVSPTHTRALLLPLRLVC